MVGANMKQKAFTLIELVLVTAIIAILAAAMIPLLRGARQDALVARTLALIDNLKNACQLYFLERGSYAQQYPEGYGLPQSDHQLTNPGFGLDPYISQHLTSDLGPSSAPVAWLYVLDTLPGSGFNLDGVGGSETVGPGNYIYCNAVDADVAKKIDDKIDANIIASCPGCSWMDTCKIEYTPSGGSMRIYLIGGT